MIYISLREVILIPIFLSQKRILFWVTYHQASKILSTASMVLSISSKTVIAGAQMEKRMLCSTQKEN